MKPFDEGHKAFEEGQLDNPYRQDTKNFKDWELGFNRAYSDNLARVKAREQAGEGGGRVQSVQKESSYAST